MFKGEYMSMETAFELASLKKENTELKNIIKELNDYLDENENMSLKDIAEIKNIITRKNTPISLKSIK